jgi:hypothetical protein
MKRLHHCSVRNSEIIIDQSTLLHISVVDYIGTLLLVLEFDHLIGEWLANGVCTATDTALSCTDLNALSISG